jgi:hypothetical protein
MAFSIEDGKSTIEVICSQDEAVQCTPEEFNEYLSDLGEHRLNLKEGVEPTRFVLTKALSYESSRKIKNQQVGYRDGEMEIRLGFILDDVRFSLTGIKNPGSGLEFKKDLDGFASKVLIEKLDAYGIAQQLYQARQAAVSAGVPKKSS